MDLVLYLHFNKGYNDTATNQQNTISCKIHGIMGKNNVETIEPTALEKQSKISKSVRKGRYKSTNICCTNYLLDSLISAMAKFIRFLNTRIINRRTIRTMVRIIPRLNYKKKKKIILYGNYKRESIN